MLNMQLNLLIIINVVSIYKIFSFNFLIAWMVSLLYLPRLYVYHSDLSVSSSTYKLFLTMEIKLIKIIALPGMMLTFLFGFILLYLQNELFSENYFIIKLLFVLLLTIFQVYLISLYLLFKRKQNNKSGSYYKFVNEIPTVFMIIIILLVVLKPDLG